MKKKHLIILFFSFLHIYTLLSQSITITTISQSDQWSPSLVDNIQNDLVWEATNVNFGTITFNGNLPSFNFENSGGSEIIITVTSSDNLEGLIGLGLAYLDITDIYFSSVNNLVSLSIKGNSTLGEIDISNLPLLEYLYAEEAGLNMINLAQNNNFKFVELQNNSLPYNELDRVVNELNQNSVSNGILRLGSQTTRATLSYNSLDAYNALVQDGWEIDVPAPTVENRQFIIFNTTSKLENWTPYLSDNFGVTLKWTARGGGITEQTFITNKPVFDLRNNNGIVEISIESTDGFSGFWRFWLNYLEVSNLDLSKATSMERLNLKSNPGLANFDVTPYPNMDRFAAEEINMTQIDVSTKPLLNHLTINNNNLPSSQLDKVLVDLDANGVQNGFLNISNQASGAIPTLAALEAFNNLKAKGWLFDLPEMNVTGEGIIISGDQMNVPNLNDGTDFGQIEFGRSIIKTFNIRNDGDIDPTYIGSSDLLLTGINPFVEISGPDASDFSIVTIPENSIAPTGFTNLGIRYNANSIGEKQAVITIRNNDFDEVNFSFNIQASTVIPGSDINITGLGNSIPGNGSNVPSATDDTDFGSVVSGGTIVKTFTIENLGDANLDLSGTPLVAVSGTNAADFSISAQPVSPVTPAGSTTFNVSYTAGSLGVRSAILTIDSNDPDEASYIFNIQAEATAAPGPEINVSLGGTSIPSGNVPDLVVGTNYGQVAIGSPITKTFNIENLGDSPLAINFAATSGVYFSQNPQFVFGEVLASGSSRSIDVIFTPLTVGVQTGTITIQSSDPNENPYIVNLSAEGVTALSQGIIEVEGNGVVITNGDFAPDVADDTDFGSVVQNTTKTNTYTINNNGTGPLNISSISIAPSTVFTFGGASQTLPFDIPAGGSITFDVNFTPTALAGSQAIVNIINSQAVNNPYQFLIAGQGVDAPDVQEIMISQYYDGFSSANKWIEVKNISNRSIASGEYYLALYNQSQSLTGAPNASQVIPTMNVGDVVLFRNTSAAIPASGNLGQPGISSPVCTFDNGDDIIIISSSDDVNSYANRVDMIGRQVTWGRNTTYIKGGCATESAHRDFEESYWIRIAVEEVNNADPLSNLALGTQAVGPTSFDGSNWSNGPGGRTRNVIISTNINPISIVACDLTIAPGLTWNYDGGTTATLDIYRDLITAGANLIVGDTESLRTRGETANLGTFTKIEKSNTLFNLHDNTYWSSPITSATIQGVFPGVNPARIFEYRAGDPNPLYSSPELVNFQYWWNKPSGSMDVGYGYAVEGPSAPVDASDNYLAPFQHQISFSGIPNNGTQIIDVFYKLSEDVGLENGNFNLLGNPYPTAINIEAFLGTNQNVYQIALWTHATEVSGGNGGEFTDADYVFYNQGGANSPDVTTNIGSSQGFMVRTTGSGGQVNFTNTMKLSNANNQFFKSDVQKKSQGLVKEGSKDRIWLRLHDGKVKSDILVGFFEESTDGLDNFFDAVDLPNNKNLNLYSKIDEDKYIIQGMGIFSQEKSVPLGFTLKEAKELNLSISGLEGVFRDIDIYLVDHALNKTHNLKDGAYKFNQTDIGDFPNRFTLQFSKNALAVDEILNSSDFVLSNSGNGFRINASKTVKEVKVYDVLGRNIEVIRPNLQSFYIDVPQAKTGSVLIFEVKLENGSILNKKAIKL